MTSPQKVSQETTPEDTGERGASGRRLDDTAHDPIQEALKKAGYSAFTDDTEDDDVAAVKFIMDAYVGGAQMEIDATAAGKQQQKQQIHRKRAPAKAPRGGEAGRGGRGERGTGGRQTRISESFPTAGKMTVAETFGSANFSTEQMQEAVKTAEANGLFQDCDEDGEETPVDGGIISNFFQHFRPGADDNRQQQGEGEEWNSYRTQAEDEEDEQEMEVDPEEIVNGQELEEEDTQDMAAEPEDKVQGQDPEEKKQGQEPDVNSQGQQGVHEDNGTPQGMETSDHDEDASQATEQAGNTGNGKKKPAEKKKKKKNKIVSPAPFQDVQPPRKFVSRYTLKIHTEDSTDSMGTLLTAVGSIIEKFREHDSKLVFIPVRKIDQLPVTNRIISKAQLVPNLTQIQKFFPTLSPRRYKRNQYIDVLMGHSIPFEELINNVDWWLRENTHGLWKKKIQHEAVRYVGWLLFSHSNLNPGNLSDAVEESLGFEVEMRWKMITVPGKYASELTPEQRISAIHVEIPQDEYAANNAAALQELYSRRSTKFPNGVHMRLIPPKNEARNSGSVVKMEHSRARQAVFCSELMHTTTSTILSLDFRSSYLQSTLRELIMTIPSGDGTSLFHSIDPAWQGGYSLHYSPEFEREASMLASGGLLPYLLHTVKGEKNKVKEELAKWFTPEAMADAENCRWNEQKKIVESKADDALNDLDDDPLCKKFHFKVAPDFHQTRGVADLNATAAVPGKDKKTKKKNHIRPKAPTDEDSLSTFGPVNKKLKPNEQAAITGGTEDNKGTKKTAGSGGVAAGPQGKDQSIFYSEAEDDDDEDDDDDDDGDDEEGMNASGGASAGKKDRSAEKNKDNTAAGQAKGGEEEEDEASDLDDDYEPSIAQSTLESLTQSLQTVEDRMETMQTEFEEMGGAISDMRTDFDKQLKQILTLLGNRTNVDAGEGQERRLPGDDT